MKRDFHTVDDIIKAAAAHNITVTGDDNTITVLGKLLDELDKRPPAPPANKEDKDGLGGQTLADLGLADYATCAQQDDFLLVYKDEKPWRYLYALRRTASQGKNLVTDEDLPDKWEITFRAECTFDGVRHINFFPDQDPNFSGYTYYPAIEEIIHALQLLEAQEKKIAWDKYRFPPEKADWSAT